MIGDVKGQHVADLGCGFGWAFRWFREAGATSVLGIDLSENMINRAKSDTSDENIEYQIMDLNQLELPANRYDLVFSSLAFHYIADFPRLMKVIFNTLKEEGRLIFSIEHPIFMSPNTPRWESGADGKEFWPLTNYSVEGERRTDWFAKDVLKFHRTMATTLNDLIGAGFQIQQVEEFFPSPQQIEDNPEWEKELHRPMFLLMKAVK